MAMLIEAGLRGQVKHDRCMISAPPTSVPFIPQLAPFPLARTRLSYVWLEMHQAGGAIHPVSHGITRHPVPIRLAMSLSSGIVSFLRCLKMRSTIDAGNGRPITRTGMGQAVVTW